MNSLNEEQQKKLYDIMYKATCESEFNKYLGVELLDLSENFCKMRIKYGTNVVNPYGSFHGGVLSALADITAGTAACMCGYCTTTVSSTLNYMLPAVNTEYVYCEATLLKRGSHMSFYDIRITDDTGRLLDSGENNYFITGKKITEL